MKRSAASSSRPPSGTKRVKAVQASPSASWGSSFPSCAEAQRFGDSSGVLDSRAGSGTGAKKGAPQPVRGPCSHGERRRAQAKHHTKHDYENLAKRYPGLRQYVVRGEDDQKAKIDWKVKKKTNSLVCCVVWLCSELLLFMTLGCSPRRGVLFF